MKFETKANILQIEETHDGLLQLDVFPLFDIVQEYKLVIPKNILKKLNKDSLLKITIEILEKKECKCDLED